jgi:hypothetical protein
MFDRSAVWSPLRSPGRRPRRRRWQMALDDDGYVWDIRLVRLDGDSLVVRQSDSLVRVPVAHINEIRLIRKSEVHLDAGGTTAGAMSALVGGDDEVYDLTPLDFADRLRRSKILLLHPSGRSGGRPHGLERLADRTLAGRRHHRQALACTAPHDDLLLLLCPSACGPATTGGTCIHVL